MKAKGTLFELHFVMVGLILLFTTYRSVFGKNEVTVTVTPNGYADAVCNGYFVMPEERTMTFGSFLDIMESVKNKTHENNGVFYVQKQNSNLTTEFSELMEDVKPDIPWATEAFGEYFVYRCCSVNSLYDTAGPSAWVCYHLGSVNISCYS